MRPRLIAALCASLLLSGCSLPNLDNLLNFSSDDDATVAAADTPKPVASAAPAAGAPDPLCASVAQQDAQQAGFDPATQQRMVQRSYAQCVAMFRAQ
jgi:hypothetical protein